MSRSDLTIRQHDHVFGQDLKRSGEPKTLLVIAITAVMMVIEIAAGIIFGSMALLAQIITGDCFLRMWVLFTQQSRYITTNNHDLGVHNNKLSHCVKF